MVAVFPQCYRQATAKLVTEIYHHALIEFLLVFATCNRVGGWVTVSNVIYSSEVLLAKRAVHVVCKITTHVRIARYYILRVCTCKNANWQSNNNGQRHSNERVPKIGYAVHFVKHRSAVKIVGTAKRVIVPQLPAVPLKLLSDTCTPMPSARRAH